MRGTRQPVVEGSANRLADPVPPWPERFGDPARRRYLRQIGDDVVAELRERPDVIRLLLLGSVVDGPCDGASDVDVLAICTGETDEIEEWWPQTDTAVNLRWYSAARLSEFAALDDDAFAREAASSYLADYLTRSETVWSRPSSEDVATAVQVCVERRRTDPTRRLIADHFWSLSQQSLDDAQRMIHRSPTRAHHVLRGAVRRALEAEMVTSRAVIHGAKRRPELVHALGGERAVMLADLAVAISGGSSLGPEGVRLLVARRSELRRAVGRLAKSWLSDPLLPQDRLEQAEQWLRHASTPFDYYRPLLEGGYWRGAANHMRTHSGVQLLPGQIERLYDLGDDGPPESVFLHGDGSLADVGKLWVEVAGLADRVDDVAALIARLRALVERDHD